MKINRISTNISSKAKRCVSVTMIAVVCVLGVPAVSAQAPVSAENVVIDTGVEVSVDGSTAISAMSIVRNN